MDNIKKGERERERERVRERVRERERAYNLFVVCSKRQKNSGLIKYYNCFLPVENIKTLTLCVYFYARQGRYTCGRICASNNKQKTSAPIEEDESVSSRPFRKL